MRTKNGVSVSTLVVPSPLGARISYACDAAVEVPAADVSVVACIQTAVERTRKAEAPYAYPSTTRMQATTPQPMLILNE